MANSDKTAVAMKPLYRAPMIDLLGPSFTGMWNLIGLPGLAVPCGFSSTGLPLSMQVVGKPFAEATALRVGDAYQRLTDWHLRVPPIAVQVGAAA